MSLLYIIQLAKMKVRGINTYIALKKPNTRRRDPVGV